MIHAVGSLLGLGYKAEDLDIGQMMLRAAVAFLLVLVVLRGGKKRALGEATPFDVVTMIMIGSIASRAVTGNAPFGPAIAATAVLVGLHWSLAAAAVRWTSVERLIKGRSRLLVEKGQIQQHALAASALTQADIEEAMREHGFEELSDIQEGRLERSGRISFIRRHR